MLFPPRIVPIKRPRQRMNSIPTQEEIDLWCQNEGCELPVYLFANKCDLLTEVQDSFLAGARMEKTCRDSVRGCFCKSCLKIKGIEGGFLLEVVGRQRISFLSGASRVASETTVVVTFFAAAVLGFVSFLSYLSMRARNMQGFCG